jgi:hypothetical protein
MSHQKKKKRKFQYPDSGHLSQSPLPGDIRGAHTVSDVISQKACSPNLKCVVTGQTFALTIPLGLGMEEGPGRGWREGKEPNELNFKGENIFLKYSICVQ